MCSFVRARMALWASRSLARFRASCAGVSVETLLVPLRLPPFVDSRLVVVLVILVDESGVDTAGDEF